MRRWEAWSVHVSTLLVGSSGVVYACIRYLLPPADPYSRVASPLQPRVQHLHVLAAPLLVFAIGLIWRHHAWSHWRTGGRERRSSGLNLLAAVAPMVASGYLLQTSVSEGWRQAWVVVHLLASALFLAGYAGHLVAAWAGRRRRRASERRAAPAGVPAGAH